MQTETYDKWYIEPTGRNANMDFGHVHQCLSCYNLQHRGQQTTEHDFPPGRPPKDLPAGTHQHSAKRTRTDVTGARSAPAGGNSRHQLSQFRVAVARDHHPREEEIRYVGENASPNHWSSGSSDEGSSSSCRTTRSGTRTPRESEEQTQSLEASYEGRD